MAEIINLRSARKQAARDAARREASGNAARHGRTPAEKAREADELARARARLDGHKRDPDPQV